MSLTAIKSPGWINGFTPGLNAYNSSNVKWWAFAILFNVSPDLTSTISLSGTTIETSFSTSSLPIWFNFFISSAVVENCCATASTFVFSLTMCVCCACANVFKPVIAAIEANVTVIDFFNMLSFLCCSVFLFINTLA